MKEKELNKKLKEDIHALKEKISNEGIQSNNNLEYLYKLVDIEKDLCEIEEGSETMKYDDYGRHEDYGRYDREDYGARRRDSRGRYMGHEHLDRMSDDYGRYMESKDHYSRGNYGAKEDGMKSLRYMLESMVDFVKMLKNEASSQEEINLIRDYTKKISEM